MAVVSLGNGWKASALPNPGLAGDTSLAGLSCTDGDNCVAAGDANGMPTIEVLKANQWEEGNPSVPAGDDDVYLNGISCVSTEWCAAVGTGFGPHGSVPVAGTIGFSK
jgi:hypothetical protein